MYSKEEIIAILKAKKPELEAKYSVSELGLFGSYVRGDQRPESDIDILVDFKDRIDGFDFVRLAHELTDALKVKTDVVSRRGVKKGYLSYVEKDLINV